MYDKDFFIETPVWNNALSFDKRKNKKLYVPKLIKSRIDSIIELWDNVVFEDFDFDWKLVSATWLKNMHLFEYKNKNMYLFDNHNHAFYFWYKELFEWKIKNNALLIHIDKHSDLREPLVIPSKPFNNLEEVFYYTNFELNVWNYIIPAKKLGLIKKDIQIRSKQNIDDFFLEKDSLFKKFNNNIILNIDLDFFEPELDYIDYNYKKELINECVKYANTITVATSPFFIDQKRALRVFKDLF